MSAYEVPTKTVVLDTFEDEVEVSTNGTEVKVVATAHDEWTVMYYTPEQARQLADALMRHAAQVHWSGGKP